jgi:Haem-binding uptake, Tiki superfamily, ChaN
MASTATLRSRRSAAQLHAIAGVEREIRANDHNSRRKYLIDFSEAFRSYDSVLPPGKLPELLQEADIILIGDYHALPASQRYAASLLRNLGAPSSPEGEGARREIVLGLETVFSRDQHILDEWMRDEIGESELRERIRFDLDWGYEWAPYYELLAAAREQGCRVYGLDCMPREDLRKIGARDRHAAIKIAEIRQQHPEALIVVLFGESHLAPNHLPRLLYDRLRTDRVLTVLQNVDALYWKAAGENTDRVEAVQVSDDVFCVFHTTPLEKYESYRLCLDRWRREGLGNPDLGPTIYNLIGGLVRFLGMNAYSPHNTTQPKFLVDSLPEVYCRTTDSILRKLLARKGLNEEAKKSLLARFEEHGSVYLPHVNAFYVCDFNMAHVAEEAARFLHHACQGLPVRANGKKDQQARPEDLFYGRTLEHAIAYFGSRVLYPARAPIRESDLYALYDQTREDVEQQTSFAFGEFIEMLDFMVLHRGYELNPARYLEVPPQVQDGILFAGAKFDYITTQVGYMLGSDLYDAYLEGRVTRRFLKSVFLSHSENPGAAAKAYFGLVAKVRPEKKRSRSVTN